MTDTVQTFTQTELLTRILAELQRQHAQDDDLWEAEQIAGYLKLKKHSVQSHVLNSAGFPSSVTLPTGGRRWVAKEIKAWALRRR